MKPLAKVDYEILNLLYVHGLSVAQISNSTKLGAGYIKELLRREDVQPLVNEFTFINEQELEGLQIRATKVLREHLDSDSEDIQNKAIEKIYRRTGKYKETVDHHITAEDVIKKFLRGSDENVENADA